MQIDAFSNILECRPLGLLQGPPGTGKTRFIGALVHYVLTQGLARNVLLASQSHEAVNNAAIAADPTLAPYLQKLGGTFVQRNIAGTDRPSAHSYGISIDLNVERSHYWRWQKGGWKNAIPQKIVDAFEDQGFIWGGRWYHFDTMHFEYRPELLDPNCAP